MKQQRTKRYPSLLGISDLSKMVSKEDVHPIIYALFQALEVSPPPQIVDAYQEVLAGRDPIT
jgi:hypothetical protein